MDRDKKYDNFDLTLEECNEILDTIDNLVVVDSGGYIKYLSPNLFKIIHAIEGRPVPNDVSGRHIEEVHPLSKICSVLKSGEEIRNCFYFSLGVTNIARIKPIYSDKKLKGAIDYDIFSDDYDLKAFMDQIVDYSLKGFLNLTETINTIYGVMKKLDSVKYCVSDIIGDSMQIKELRKQIHAMAESESTVMIIGQTGCGKELVAHSIHNVSRRRMQHIVEINCAAIPDNLFESELFGYEPGAFTGSDKKGKKGLFESADGGTLLLDEIGEMPISLQAKLLRVLQDQQVRRIGGSKTIHVNVRLIASTNASLKAMIAQKKFREDLYYRINVIEIKVPPLSQRKEDVPLLAEHFVNIFNTKYNCNKSYLTTRFNISLQ